MIRECGEVVNEMMAIVDPDYVDARNPAVVEIDEAR